MHVCINIGTLTRPLQHAGTANKLRCIYVIRAHTLSYAPRKESSGREESRNKDFSVSGCCVLLFRRVVSWNHGTGKHSSDFVNMYVCLYATVIVIVVGFFDYFFWLLFLPALHICTQAQEEQHQYTHAHSRGIYW